MNELPKIKNAGSILVNTERDGKIAVETWKSANNKYFYLLRVDFKNSDKWRHQRITVLENEVPVLFSLIRKSVTFPKNSYQEVYKSYL